MSQRTRKRRSRRSKTESPVRYESDGDTPGADGSTPITDGKAPDTTPGGPDEKLVEIDEKEEEVFISQIPQGKGELRRTVNSLKKSTESYFETITDLQDELKRNFKELGVIIKRHKEDLYSMLEMSFDVKKDKPIKKNLTLGSLYKLRTQTKTEYADKTNISRKITALELDLASGKKLPENLQSSIITDFKKLDEEMAATVEKAYGAIRDTTDKMNEAYEEVNGLKEKCKSLEDDNRKLRVKRNEIKEDLKELEKDLDGYKKDCEEKREVIRELTKDNYRLKGYENRVREVKGDWRKEVNKLLDEKERLEEELNNKKLEYEEMERDRDEFRADYVRYREERDRFRSSYEDLTRLYREIKLTVLQLDKDTKIDFNNDEQVKDQILLMLARPDPSGELNYLRKLVTNLLLQLQEAELAVRNKHDWAQREKSYKVDIYRSVLSGFTGGIAPHWTKNGGILKLVVKDVLRESHDRFKLIRQLVQECIDNGYQFSFPLSDIKADPQELVIRKLRDYGFWDEAKQVEVEQRPEPAMISYASRYEMVANEFEQFNRTNRVPNNSYCYDPKASVRSDRMARRNNEVFERSKRLMRDMDIQDGYSNNW